MLRKHYAKMLRTRIIEIDGLNKGNILEKLKKYFSDQRCTKQYLIRNCQIQYSYD